MIYKVPQENKKFQKSNDSDLKGNIRRAKNVEFDAYGYVRLEDRMRSVTNSVLLTDLNAAAGGTGLADIVFDSGLNEILLLGTELVYKSAYTVPTVFTQDSTTGNPTLDSGGSNDGAEFDDDIYVAHGGTLTKKAGSTWSVVSSVGNPDIVEEFVNLKQLACGGDNEVELIDTSDVVQTTLVLPDEFSVTDLAYNNHRMAVATRNTNDSGKAILFVWDGLTSSANAGYEVNAHTIYAVIPYKDGFACVTSEGRLLYNAGGWQELDNFPVYYKRVMWDDNQTATVLSRKVAPNAMDTDGEKIYIGINPQFAVSGNRNSSRFDADMPGGVWCYDPAVGLYPRWTVDGSLALRTNAITTANVNTTTNVITVAGVTVPISGTPVFYYNGISSLADSSSATPLKAGTRYYAIYQSGTTLKLATTYANAIAGTAIDLTGTGNNDQFLVFNPEDQLGGIRGTVSTVKLLPYIFSDNVASSQLGRLMIGGLAYGDDMTGATYIATVNTGQTNHGYVTYSKLESQDVEDDFQFAYVKFRSLLNAEDRITVWARNRDNPMFDYETANEALDYTRVWTDGNTFTTTSPFMATVKAQYDAGNSVMIEITAGKGAGFVAKVESITENAGTYTVNIDRTIPDVTNGDVFRCVWENWTKLDELTVDSPTNDSGFFEVAIGHNGTWEEVRVDLEGWNVEISEMQVCSQTVKSTSQYNN